MNKSKQIAFCLALGLVTASCGNDTEDGSSTPIDTTNVHGTAPATYSPEDPAHPNAPVYEGNLDTGLQSNTMSAEDSAKMRKK
ncbi:hypothetical protein [Polluticoccus soli]|uniref:hypothetical protein n=1 Tax=Polluticoccus soli TaxID=3034150 RepID=UPI0023E1A51B|nr:hypothetical protein [Flavipsychrobacter sp. JY13-12]